MIHGSKQTIIYLLIYYRHFSLLFTKQQILDSSKLKKFADDNFKFEENGRKFFKRVENTVGNGEIACYEQFLLFPQCFQKGCFPGASKGVIVWEWVNSLPNDKFSDWRKLQAFADNKINATLQEMFFLGLVENIVGKGKKCWLPAFSPFLTMFVKDFFFRVIKSREYEVRS